MGNHHSHRSQTKSGESTPSSTSTSNGNSRKNTLSRKFSLASNHEECQNTQQPPQQTNKLVSIEMLSKILTEKSADEEGVNGVSRNVFTKYLFPRYTVMSEKLYEYFRLQSGATKSYLTSPQFQQQCEKFLSILDDEGARDMLVRIFSSKDAETENDVVTPEALTSLLMCTYHVSMDHYSGGPQMCMSISKTLRAVVDSCFHTKTQLSCQFVSHWLAANCPRLLLPLHRYIVHSLATSYRTLEENGPQLAAGKQQQDSVDKGLELATPVLEQPPPFGEKNNRQQNHMLNMSMSWLLAGALPPIYSKPQKAPSPNSSATALASMTFLSKLLSAIPSHWLNIYDSNENGLGANRFLHHVLGYKGPTLILLKAVRGDVFCLASPHEWKESHLYVGGEDCVAFQLLPKFAILEKGSKMLYLNLSFRGYPYGLRAGKDPRNPVISVNGDFDKIECRKVPYNLDAIEVWGCGDQVSREAQLDIKKWEVKEAERQRCVKLSAADWLDHPDRYLLELAGRPQYSQN